MRGYKPSLNWARSTTTTAAAVGTQGPVASYVSTDGRGVVVTYSTATRAGTNGSGDCDPVVATSPWVDRCSAA